MTTVFMERTFDSPLDKESLRNMALEAADCAGLYRVDWVESFLSEDGHTLVCCFEAPDAEALRMVAEGDTSREKAIRSGTVHDAREGMPNVVVERRFDEPVTVESLQAIEDRGAWCLETYNVTFLRTYFSRDQKHMLCLYQAPDAESVRLAQQQAEMPVSRVWPCQSYTMETLFG